jgi:hypothetical protein
MLRDRGSSAWTDRCERNERHTHAILSGMDDALLDVILGRIDGDISLSEGATDLLLAACQDDHALAAAVGGEPPLRPQRWSAAQPAPQPVGAFIASITVEGFRGVGPAHTLTLHPGPGLTVVAGRNGSGKSSFAEGLEVLLTGTTPRFETYAVFKDGWRNLHHRHPTRIAAEFCVEGAPGSTVVERAWAAGADLDGSSCTVQVAGEKATGIERLGWTAHLTTYKPFLAHSDLEAMFDGKPSDLYDRLAAVLGLGDLVTAHDRLREQRRTLESAAKEVEAERRAILQILGQMDDERAVRSGHVLGAREPNFDVLGSLVTGGSPAPPGGLLDVLRQLASLAAPDLATVQAVADDLQQAAGHLEAVAGTEAARARSLADLLNRAVQFHKHHPTETDCPVCGRAAALDGTWRLHADAEIQRLRGEAEAAERAHADAAAAVRAATALVRPVPAAVSQPNDSGIDTADLAHVWTTWVAIPPVSADDPDDLRRLGDHLALTVELADAIAAVRKSAAGELASREDRWSPVARRIAVWIEQGRDADRAKPVIKELKAAERWLKAAHDDIRNERLRPIADRAQQTWRSLRHESNVELGAIRLAGDATRRRVVLDATVDGTDGSALGVMSQGEVNALALSVFLPRATLPESPFRFVVIDDPVQAMDPAKVDGLARVLQGAAHSHQLVVFTHDDRLPNALRRLGLDARIVQVQRRRDSIVEISPADDPIRQALRDARSVAADSDAPEDVKRRVVPGLCRLALEAALTEITQRRELRAGRPHYEVDDLLDTAKTLHQKAALAIYGDTGAADRVMSRLNAIARRHGDTFMALKTGAHGALTGSARGTVIDTEGLISALRAALP